MEKRLENVVVREDGKIPRKLSGPCPNCKEPSVFTYLGRITSSKLAVVVDNYNCNGCQSTFDLRDLIGKYGEIYEPEDLINPHTVRKSLWSRAKKLIIKGIYSI